MSRGGLTEGQPFRLECTVEDGHGRAVRGLRLVGCDLPDGRVAACWPDVNPPVPAHQRGKLSGAPACKTLPVRIRPDDGALGARAAE